jgi:hypothetical protein
VPLRGLFVPFRAQKTERPVLDRPLKVGGGIQPRLVTVLTPATTFTVGQDFIQKRRAVNSAVDHLRFSKEISSLYVLVRTEFVGNWTGISGGADGTRTRDLRRDRPAF